MKLQAFKINGSGGFCFYLQAVMESGLVQIQDFAANGSDRASDGACFYLHAGLFLAKLQVFILSFAAAYGMLFCKKKHLFLLKHIVSFAI